MKVKETFLSGTYILENEIYKDSRGIFTCFYIEEDFKINKLNTQWSQLNFSSSLRKGTLRGLHFQYPPFSQIKLIRTIKGCIFDVVVDLRPKSKTYGKYFSYILNSKSNQMIYIPDGCAHGFLTLENNTEIIYQVSKIYQPAYEETIIWNDIDLKINWPFNPIELSNKDKYGLDLKKIDDKIFNEL